MKIPSIEPGGLKRPADVDGEIQNEQSARRPKLGPSRQSLDKKYDGTEADKVSKLDGVPTQNRPVISISLAGVEKPKTAGFNIMRPNPLLKMKESGASSSGSRENEKSSLPKRGIPLLSGPNPLKTPPFWKRTSLIDHATRHIKDTMSRDQTHYEEKSIALLTAPVTPDKPAYIRVNGLPDGSREANDVARHDTMEQTIAVAKSNGEVRTYHGQSSSTPGRKGLLSESADDFERGLKKKQGDKA